MGRFGERWLDGLAMCFAITMAIGRGHAAELEARSWMIGTEKREALVVIPENARQQPAPVVFAFHGHGGNMRNAARTFHIHQLWPEAICVYMQGLNTPGRLTDPEGKKPGWQHSAGDQADRDLKFFDTVLETLHKEAKVDDGQVFATGHSNGGGFSYLLGSQRGDRLTAIAPSASSAARKGSLPKPMPVLHIAGRNDQLVKFAWQETMIEALRQAHGCEAKPSQQAGGRCDVYASPKGYLVATMIHDGNHAYPKEAPEVIVDFFKHYRQWNKSTGQDPAAAPIK